MKAMRAYPIVLTFEPALEVGVDEFGRPFGDGGDDGFGRERVRWLLEDMLGKHGREGYERDDTRPRNASVVEHLLADFVVNRFDVVQRVQIDGQRREVQVKGGLLRAVGCFAFAGDFPYDGQETIVRDRAIVQTPVEVVGDDGSRGGGTIVRAHDGQE